MLSNFRYFRGQEYVKRALEVAMAGQHNIRLIGAPGMGKTTLAYLALDLVKDGNTGFTTLTSRFESIHSYAGFVMVENTALAPEQINVFNLGARQPDGVQIISTIRPCPCGYYGTPYRPCTCTAEQVITHCNAMDDDSILFDIHIEVAWMDWEKLAASLGTLRHGEDTEAIRARVRTARLIQQSANTTLGRDGMIRFSDYNGRADWALIEERCDITKQKGVHSLLKAAYKQLNMTPGQYFSAIRVARTIADLSGSSDIQAMHVAEAIQYRANIKAAPVRYTDAEPETSEPNHSGPPDNATARRRGGHTNF